MRILRISGRNLASLAGAFEVKLTQGPLAAQGLFAISGPTGAGKSTLLDAVCLALFDATPRLHGRSSVLIADSGAPDDPKLRHLDVRNLLTRGAVDGAAEVDFVGRDHREYRARWQVRRARGATKGRLQEQELSLVCTTTGERLGDKKTEVLEAIEDRLGLTFEQFRRSALLAQGEFAAFLRASGAERAQLLERMTETEIYSDVSRWVFERQRSEVAKVQQANAARAAVSVLEVNARAEHEEAIARLTHQLSEAAVQVRELEASLAWWAQGQRMARRVEHAAQAKTHAEEAWAALAPSLRELEALERARAGWPLWERRHQAEEARAQARAARDAASELMVRAKGVSEQAEQALARHEERQREVAANAEAVAPELEAARRLEQALQSAIAERDRYASELAAAEAEEARHSAALADVTRQIQGLELATNEAQAWLNARPELEGLALAWPTARHEVERWLGATERARADAARAAEAQAALELARPAVAAAEREVEVAAALSGERASIRDAAVAQRAELDPAGHARARAALEGALQRASALAEALGLGEQSAAAELAHRAAEAEHLARQDRARSGAAEAASAEAAAAAQVRLVTAAAQAARDALELSERRAQLVAGEPCPLCGALEHPYRAQGGAPVATSAMDEAVSRAEAERLQWVQRRAALEQLVLAEQEACQRARSNALQAADTSAAALASWAGQSGPEAADWGARRLWLTQEREALAARRAELREREFALERANREVDVAQAALEQAQQRAEHARVALAAAQRELQAKEDGHRAALHAHQLTQRETHECQRRLTQTLTSLPDWEQEATRGGIEWLRTVDGRLDERAASATEAERERALEAAAAELEAHMREAALTRHHFAEFQSVGAAEVEARRAKVTASLELVQRSEVALREADLAQREHAAARPPIIDDTVTEAMLAERAEQARRHERAALEERARLSALIEADESALALAGRLDQEVERAKERARVWEQLNEVIGAGDGKKFRMLAQNLALDELLLHANARLCELSPRYRLERVPGHDLELQIADLDQGGEVRSIQTLSGGESFLASLALALGLSQLAAGRVSVETLFIDEGFGTLDRQSLEVAVAALDALQSTGCQVGIISHVDGLAERLGAGVRVRPLGGGRSVVEVFEGGAS
jgi:exonuclease SbcC